MTRAILALVLGIGLGAAPAAHAAMLACQPDTPQACCCPEPSSASPCEMSCAPDVPAEAGMASPAGVRPAAAWDLGLAPLHASPSTLSATSGLSPTAQHTLHAPPRRRYLLACVLRL